MLEKGNHFQVWFDLELYRNRYFAYYLDTFFYCQNTMGFKDANDF